MKRLFLAASLALFSVGALGTAWGSALANEVTTTLKVSGWHCADCADETVTALKKVKGVKSANINFDKSQVVVAYDDSKAKPSDLEKAVKKAGYTVSK